MIEERSISRSKVKITYDLVELLNKSGFSREKRIALRPFVTRQDVKLIFGRRAIQTIIDRKVDDNIDRHSEKFDAYSPKYIESLEFKVFDKSAGDVNLKLTGQMDAAMEVLGTTQTGVVIGIDDSDQASKAHGHIIGGGKLPVRDFFGLPSSVALDIFQEVVRDSQETPEVLEFQEALDLIQRPEFTVGEERRGFLFEEDFQ